MTSLADVARWIVRLDAAAWMRKELTVRPINLKVTDSRKSLPDKIVLAMAKLLGTGLRRSFLSWKCVIADRTSLRLKARKVVHRMRYGIAYKAIASLKLNSKLKQAARAKAETRRRLEEVSAARISANVAVGGGSRRFVGRRHPHYIPGDHHGDLDEGHEGAQFQNASASELYRAGAAPSSRTPHAFEQDADVSR